MKNANVLIVGNQENMSEVFLDQGMTVIKVACLEEAREALKSYSFDVVVTDVTVPMMDGLEIAKLVYSELPVVAISNNSDHSGRFSNICDCIIEKLDIEDRLYFAALKAIERRNMGIAFAA
ncbi:MAG: DNA-binding NtrC family response regulator [Bacteriovoracaceae bacterium]|jgi:DNA-binding NtrC family response regulator